MCRLGAKAECMRKQGRNLGLPQVVGCRFCLFIRQKVLKVTRPVTTLRTAWTKLRKNAEVIGRWHDNRPTLVTELAPATRIMSIERRPAR